ncbi:diacylglyceryl transferase [Flavobacterium sp. 316]|uniref:Phosphatidylglycerol--prolipoprotein diacylglyceryl transferase n=1 Tax=Flavobacterium sediminilitoris TaxID=2024526 RepID=A0ABY4HM85_9FLAO|nr:MULTISPECIES: prolipoprotein diacylglyceryl transferase [Flavobacterium]KIX22378.1 diacylglyceryl transferase [Flavobacterium sp. 316]UOX33683.1 prolipoprotein diacylglyceryl transferase [Flavobacterium sediminilitoris]
MQYSLNMVWNPSEGIDLGFFMVRYYSLMFVVAFGLGWYIMKNIYKREGLSMEKLDNLFVYTVIATLVGARLGHVFFYDWDYFKDHKLEILLPIKETASGWEFTGFAGLASHGAAIAIILVMYFYSKKVVQKPILWVLDRVVIPVASGAIFVRLGNFMNSEIVGTQTSSSFGIKFIKDWYSPREAFEKTGIGNAKDAYKAIETNPQFSQVLADVVPKHPAQLYEAFGYVFVFAILFYMYWKTDARNKQGLLFGTFLVLLWTVRFLVEYVKESQGGFENALGVFSTGQWLSIPFVIIGLYFVFKSLVKK